MSKIYVPGAKTRGDGEAITGNFNELYVPDAKDIRAAKLAKLEMKIAGRIGALLVSKYNNRQWKVQIDLANGMLIIACDSVSNHKGYHIHTHGRTVHELETRSVAAAGEILERHALSRKRQFNADNLEGLIRDQFDNVITADSKAEPI